MARTWMLASHFGIGSKFVSEDTNINTQEDSSKDATETGESSDAETRQTTTQERTHIQQRSSLCLFGQQQTP